MRKSFVWLKKNVYIKKKPILKVNLIFTDDPNTSLFHDAVLDDMETSTDEWDSLVKILQDQGYEETATNVLSTITVMSAMKTVLYKSLADDRPDSAATQGWVHGAAT